MSTERDEQYEREIERERIVDECLKKRVETTENVDKRTSRDLLTDSHRTIEIERRPKANGGGGKHKKR